MTGRTVFKDKEELDKFCNESMFCVCGSLMTGLHMGNCQKLRRIKAKYLNQHELAKSGKEKKQGERKVIPLGHKLTKKEKIEIAKREQAENGKVEK